LALEENPFEIIKRNLSVKKESFLEMKMTRNLRCKRKLLQIKPKPKPIKIDDLMKT
jgi:hypothetical protein